MGYVLGSQLPIPPFPPSPPPPPPPPPPTNISEITVSWGPLGRLYRCSWNMRLLARVFQLEEIVFQQQKVLQTVLNTNNMQITD